MTKEGLMSFTPAGVGRDRSFELVKRSLWQDELLPFSDALTMAQMEQAFEAQEVSFGGDPHQMEEESSEDGGLVDTSRGLE